MAPQLKKAPKSSEFVDTGSDDTDDEQGPPQDEKEPPLLGDEIRCPKFLRSSEGE